jgi:hypothetical protein
MLTAVSERKSNDEIFEQIYWFHKSQYKILYRIVKRVSSILSSLSLATISIEIFW